MRYTLGDTTTTTDLSTGSDQTTGSPGFFSQLVQGFAQYKLAQSQLDTQKQITALQLARAQQGLPPLNIDPSTLGVPSVSVGLSPATQQIITYGLFAGLGLIALNMILKRV
jgi:hypothetical protein